MKFMCTKYGINATKSVHFVDVFMGGIIWGHSVIHAGALHHGLTKQLNSARMCITKQEPKQLRYTRRQVDKPME